MNAKTKGPECYQILSKAAKRQSSIRTEAYSKKVNIIKFIS